MNDVFIKIGGTQKTLELLEAKQRQLDEPILRPVTHCETRWNSQEHVAQRYLKMQAVIEQLDIRELFRGTAKEKQKVKQFKEKLDFIKKTLPLLQEILPIMTRCAQWVQILSSKTWVTISKVRLALIDLSTYILELSSRSQVSERF